MSYLVQHDASACCHGHLWQGYGPCQTVAAAGRYPGARPEASVIRDQTWSVYQLVVMQRVDLGSSQPCGPSAML